MANSKITMLKLKTLMQYLAAGRSYEHICKQLNMGKSTLSDYRQRAIATGESFQALSQLDDAQLKALLQPPGNGKGKDPRLLDLEPLLPGIVSELREPHTTMEYLWEQYIKRHPHGYKLTQFKQYIREYRKAHNVAYMNPYRPGEEMQVDFAGDVFHILDPVTEETREVYMLCAMMPYSGFGFGYRMTSTDMEHTFHGLSRCLAYLDSAPLIAKSDNMRQWVQKADRYVPTFTETCLQWGLHYGICMEATRVKKPRDKGPVEGIVDKFYDYVYQRLKKRAFHDVDTLNAYTLTLIDEFNSKLFTGHTRSRREIYESEERPGMMRLPETHYRIRYRKEVSVGPNYHVKVGSEQHLYSVPYTCVSKKAIVLWDLEEIEIYVDSERVAVHKRDYGNKPTTLEHHMPENHRAYHRSRNCDAKSLLDRALLVGPETRWAVDRLLSSRIFPQQSYGNCNNLLAMGVKYGEERLETTCRMIHQQCEAVTLAMVKNILQNNLDLAHKTGSGMIVSSTPANDKVRGSNQYTTVTL